MPRRKKRKSLTESQIQEIRRKGKNYKSRKRYTLKQKELFLIEYKKICKKYGCFILAMYGPSISKQKRNEEIYTIKSNIESLRSSLDNEY